jgi:2',3'-cyclic-nucleotide 2'-phosphodiesterase (5'-nucleotidase family)
MFVVAENGAADFNIMKEVGYDAACLGNHEFTYGPDGLAAILENARTPIIPLLSANINFGDEKSDDALEALWGDSEDTTHQVYPSVVLTTRSGVKVGVFGLVGESVLVPEALPVTFSIDFDDIQILVRDLRSNKEVDVVVLLIHAGISEKDGEVSGEVADIARNVDGIDVIAAGHSHAFIETQVKASNAKDSSWITTIVEAKDGGKYLGRVNLYLDDNNKVIPSKTTTSIIPIDDTIVGDKGMVEMGEKLIHDIESNYLSRFPPLAGGRVFDELTRVSFPLGRLNSAYLVTDAMRIASRSDFAFASLGGEELGIRKNGPEGIVHVHDAFESMRRGMGSDQTIGPPLYKYYLSLKEIIAILEVTTVYMGKQSSDYLLVPSGLRIIYDSRGEVLRRIRKLYTVNPDETVERLIYDDTSLASGAWMSDSGWQDGLTGREMFSITTTRLLLYGLRDLNRKFAGYGFPFKPIEPRTSAGTPVAWTEPEELDQFICVFDDSYPAAFRGKEIKAWYGVARMLASFGGTVPNRYEDAYTDGSSNNPIGPPRRRIWDIGEHGDP